MGIARLGLLALFAGLSVPLAAQEVCGIDTLFWDGFQVATPGNLAAYPGAQLSPGISQSIVGGVLSVSVVAPTNNAQIGTNTTQVTGSYTGPTNVGITVNGVIALVHNGQFAVPAVALVPGANTLQVTVTKMTGETATTSVPVTQTGSPPVATLLVDRAVGYAPFSVTFTPRVGPLPAGATLQSVAIDYDGNGTDDVTAPSLAAVFSYRYAQPGLYPARLTLIDTQANQYVAQRMVVIQDLARQRGMLCDVYGYLKQRLTAQPVDIAGALKALQPRLRPYYQNLYTMLGGNLTPTVNSLGVIVTGLLSSDFAELLVVRGSGATRAGYPIQYTLGADGVWRISSM